MMAKLKKFIINYPVYSSVIILVLAISLFLSLGLFTPKVGAARQKNLPIYGWIVWEDLGFGEIPGHPPAHRFRLVNFSGGQSLLAFCLDQYLPPPPIGQICERISKDIFWCGEIYQPVKIYEIQATTTPQPSITPTATNTPTRTNTPTAMSTPTETPTPTISHTLSVAPTERQRMGGEGNFQSKDLTKGFLGVIIIGFGVSMAMINFEIRQNNRKHNPNR